MYLTHKHKRPHARICMNNHAQTPTLCVFYVSGPQDTTHPFGLLSQSHEAQIGISVEPLATLTQQTPAPSAAPSNVALMMQAATKMLEGFVNYTTSFALTQSRMTPNPTEMFVPLSTMQQWYENFQKKLTLDPQLLFKS